MAFRDRERIDHLQDFYRDLWKKAVAVHAQGIPPTKAAETISMYEHADHFGGAIPRNGVDLHAIQRIYELLDSGYSADTAPARFWFCPIGRAPGHPSASPG